MTTFTITKLRARMLANLDEKGEPIAAWKVGAACHIDATTLSGYVRGRRPFTQKNLQSLCKYFKCEASDIAGWMEFSYAD